MLQKVCVSGVTQADGKGLKPGDELSVCLSICLSACVRTFSSKKHHTVIFCVLVQHVFPLFLIHMFAQSAFSSETTKSFLLELACVLDVTLVGYGKEGACLPVCL